MIDSISEKVEYHPEEPHLHWLANLSLEELQWMKEQRWQISHFGQYLLDHISHPYRPGKAGVAFQPNEDIEVLWKLCL